MLPPSLAEIDRQRMANQDRHRRLAMRRLIRRACDRGGAFWMPEPNVVAEELRRAALDLEQEHASGKLLPRWGALTPSRGLRYRPGSTDVAIVEAARKLWADAAARGLNFGLKEAVAALRRRGLRRRSVDFMRLVRLARDPFVAKETSHHMSQDDGGER